MRVYYYFLILFFILIQGHAYWSFREKEMEGDSHWGKRETSVSCLLYVPWPGTEPVTQACAPTRNQTGKLSLCGIIPNQLSYTGLGSVLVL